MLKPETPPFPPPNATSHWTSTQLLHVETELGKEYPNLSRHTIHHAVVQAQACLSSEQGTVRLLVQARRQLGTSGLSGGNALELGASFPLHA